MIVEAGNVRIQPVADDHLELAVQCRANNADFYVTGNPDAAASLAWIKAHRHDPTDALLEIVHLPDRTFLGTVGYTLGDGFVDVGRLGLHTPSLRTLLSSGHTVHDLTEGMERAARMLLGRLFDEFPVGSLRAEVMKHNRLSLAFCDRLGFREEPDERRAEYQDGLVRLRIDRKRYERSKHIECLFFQHNMIEETHHAIGDLIQSLQESGVRFRFAAKRVLRNAVYEQIGSPDIETLSSIPIWKPYFKGVDLLHIVYDGEPSLMLCAIGYVYGIPYILTFHGGDDTNAKIFRDGIREKTAAYANRAAAVTVVCEQDERSLRSIGVTGRILVMPPAIRDFAAGTAQTHAGGRDPRRIAVVGRLVEKKGVDTAIRALRSMPPEYRLDIVGDGPLRDTLHELAASEGVAGRIDWHGMLPIEEMIGILDRDAILWHPATTAADGNAEGIPQVLLYAMARGMVVVTTRSGHIADLVEDGRNGLLVDPDDPRALAETTDLVMADGPRAAQLIAGGHQTADGYRLDRQAARWHDLYREVGRSQVTGFLADKG